MDLPLELSPTYLLPSSQHQVYDQLQGQLKDIFYFRLLSAGGGIHVEIAIVALDIISQCSSQFPEQDVVFQRQKERFFTALLSEIHAEIKITSGKVLEITRKGFFKEFIENIDSKKTTYHTSKELIKIVSDFHLQILPALIKQKAEKSSIVQNQKNSQTSLSANQAYDRILLCQTYFGLPKLIYEFLALLSPNQKWKQETYEFFFHLINFEHHLHFDDFEKEQLAKIVIRLHSPFQETPFQHCSEIDIKEFVDLCYQLKYRGGEEILGFYFSCLKTNTIPSIDKMIHGLNLLLLRLKTDDSHLMILQWIQKNYSWNQLLEQLETDLIKTDLNDTYFQDDVQNRLSRFKNDPTVIQPLSDADLDLIDRQYKIIDELCKKHSHLKFNQLMNLAHQIRQIANQGALLESNRLLLIAIGRLAIRIEFSIYPYSTQILALLGLLTNGKSRQAQVKTGEGKSVIVALWAFVMAMECRTVDIITSARYLAIRDHDKFANFFQRCGITTGHICFDNKTPKLFNAQILYGPAFDFEFAWMEDLLWGKQLFQERLKNPYVSRNFDVVCVDESDNLLIDTAQNGARLAYPAEVSYDWVYAPILSFVHNNKILVEQQSNECISELRKYLKSNIIEKNQRECLELTEEKLKLWIKSAYHALFELKEDDEYIVSQKRNDENHLVKTIQIVELCSGRISENSRWSNGTHEFLEVKHDIPVEKESLTPITLSHAVFYQFYKTITAITGTSERFQTKEIYQIDSFDIPPHRPLQRKDYAPLFLKNYESATQSIIENTRAIIKQKRPILILCPTISDTKKLAVHMKKANINYQLLNEVQEEREHVILSQAGAPGKVTIATNTAGRGTDIILNEESLKNGGLHVLLTFFPDSKRVEDQAIGRAGRQGQPGSSQIILNKEDAEIKDLMIGQGSCSDHKILEMLNTRRELREKSQASINVTYADLERFLAKKTHFFFEFFQNWAKFIDQDIVIEKFAQKISSITLNSRKIINFDHLRDADLIIAEECRSLLTKKSDMLSWKILLKKVIERIKKKAIHEWVHLFFEPSEKKLKEVALNINMLKSQLENGIFKLKKEWEVTSGYTLFDFMAKQFLNELDKQMQTNKSEINLTFEGHRPRWEKWLARDGSGLFVYLKEITDINLLPVILR